MASEHVIAVDESNFQEVVLESREPVLVDFWAEWCGPCKMLSPIIDEVAKENVGKVKICKLNVDNAQRISKRYGVHEYPNCDAVQRWRRSGARHWFSTKIRYHPDHQSLILITSRSGFLKAVAIFFMRNFDNVSEFIAAR